MDPWAAVMLAARPEHRIHRHRIHIRLRPLACPLLISHSVDGLVPALWVGAGAVALAAAVALLMPRRSKADGPAAGLSTAAPAAI